MQSKIIIYFCMVIFLVFEVSVYYYFNDASTSNKTQSSSSSSTSVGGLSSIGGELDYDSSSFILQPGDVLCSRETFLSMRQNFSSCICITDNVTLVNRHFDLRQLAEYIRQHRLERFDCAMTVDPNGRLGNLMGEYATLYALAKLNNRPAFLATSMAQTLRSYFRISMPSISSSATNELEYLWTNVEVRRWMEPSYGRLSEMFVRILGPPWSWTFYEDFKDEIVREFTFHDAILRQVQAVLRTIADERQQSSTKQSSITFIGVHARRTDAIGWIENYHGRVADNHFFAKAMNHFRQKYGDDVVFVVASDDMKWCRKNIDASLGDVHFIGQGNVDNPIHDFALLANCNHSIISIGTYGYWTAYLAGGDTIYLANYTNPDSHYLKKFTYETMYLPNWIGIS